MRICSVSSPINRVSGCLTQKHWFTGSEQLFPRNKQPADFTVCASAELSGKHISKRKRVSSFHGCSSLYQTHKLSTSDCCRFFFFSLFDDFWSISSFLQGTSTPSSMGVWWAGLCRSESIAVWRAQQVPRGGQCSVPFWALQWGDSNTNPPSLLPTWNCSVYQQHTVWEMVQTVLMKLRTLNHKEDLNAQLP